jgi:polar amino acid transport system substrate-binding protein
MYLRKGEESLRDALDAELGRLIEGGELRAIYERYGLWDEVQGDLAGLGSAARGTAEASGAGEGPLRGWALLGRYGPTLLQAAGMTVFLACASMPLAMGVGLLVALGRMYGPRWLALLLRVYVELIRGTPLMLQLYVLFFVLPRVGVQLHPLVAGVAGLAINYSAYEAEIYRAGLQAVPVGQMEAALALGMTRRQALRRVVVPQAVRIVIPPVASDFIALFKDTSVCSVISVVELTKQYAIFANSTGGVLELAAATAVLYLVMSVPLSMVARRIERGLAAEGPAPGRKGASP